MEAKKRNWKENSHLIKYQGLQETVAMRKNLTV